MVMKQRQHYELYELKKGMLCELKPTKESQNKCVDIKEYKKASFQSKLNYG